ncbi:hypothetical protein NC651_026434 [Populus alba x Populus x berolinensis]|nr:hypothetical protein NC651_026434 [Populus alba x Populus x berolinensis]
MSPMDRTQCHGFTPLAMMIPCAACSDWEMNGDVNRCRSQMRWRVLTVFGSIRPCPIGESRTRLFSGPASCRLDPLYINTKS